MFMPTLARISALTLTLSIGVAAHASEWKIDQAHSRVGFTIRHMMVSNVEGQFKDFDGTVMLDEKDITKSKVNVSIDMSSIDTANEKRDDHLRGDDFFHVEKFPKMTFTSKKVEKKGNKMMVHGDLSLHGVTKPVVLEVEEWTEPMKAQDKLRRGAVAHTKISRKDFGLTWNKAIEAGGVAVGDEVKIRLSLALVTNAG